MCGTVAKDGTLLVTGANGRLGSLLRLLWASGVCGLTPLWSGRTAPPTGMAWHIGNGSPMIPASGVVVLHLAAVLRGTPAQLARNAADTAVVCDAAIEAGARHVFVASTAAVYRPGAFDLAETDLPDPANPYGASKLAAEVAARQMLSHRHPPGLTILRIGNVAGADAVLGSAGLVTLDPVPGQPAGPLRSYIGPGRLAQVLSALVGRAVSGQSLPEVLNIAEPGIVGMADLLTAADRSWHFGPPRPGTVARVGLDTGLLQSLVPMPPATARGIVADLRAMKGRWP